MRKGGGVSGQGMGACQGKKREVFLVPSPSDLFIVFPYSSLSFLMVDFGGVWRRIPLMLSAHVWGSYWSVRT